MRLVKSFSVLTIFFTLVFSSVAQFDTIIVTVSIPQEVINLVNTKELFTPFYNENPNIQVVFVPHPAPEELTHEFILDAPNAYLDDVARYAQSADVVMMNSRYLRSGGTRAGYFLNLQPLIDSDRSLIATDYFPAAWNAFRWEDGIWALPLNTRLQFLAYTPDAFAELNLSAPISEWSGVDFLNTVQKLSDQNFSVAVPLQFGGGNDLLLRSIYGKAFSDPNGLPDFNNEEVYAFLEQIRVLRDKEYRSSNPSMRTDVIPLTMTETSFLLRQREGQPNVPVALPNHVVGAMSDGFAISAGTQNRENAYKVARFLMEDATFVQYIAYDAPAKRSLTDSIYSNLFPGQFDEATQEFLHASLETAIPSSELLFAEFVDYALTNSDQYNDDLRAAVADIQLQARNALQIAEERKNTGDLVISTPVLPPTLMANESALAFTVRGTSFGSAGDETQLQEVLNDFAEMDGEIGFVELLPASRTIPIEELDCYIQPVEAVLNTPNTEFIQPLSPYTDADAQFAESDYLPGILDRFEQDNQFLGLPFTLSPNWIQVNPEVLERIGASALNPSWDVTEFEGILRFLYQADIAPVAPLVAGDVMPYLILTASYGGLPIRFEDGFQASYHFTDPQSVAALQQVLDLAREGLMGYVSNSGGSNLQPQSGFPAMFFASPYSFVNSGGMLSETPYPSGRAYTPVSYSLDGFFISKTSVVADACYRLYNFLLLERPELLKAIPVRYSTLANDGFAQAIGTNLIQSYQAYASQLASPNTVIFPLDYSSIDPTTNPIRYQWITEAFDAYVLNNGNLEVELAALQSKLDGLDACLANIKAIPSLQSTSAEVQEYQNQVNSCILEADPDFNS